MYMDANELLNLIKEINDDLDREWKNVEQMQDQIIELSKRIAQDAHEKYINRVKSEIKSYTESEIPEIKKEVEAIKENYERQRTSMEEEYRRKWDKIKENIKSIMVKYFNEK